MKYTNIALTLILFFTISATAFADQKGEIRLTDGSVFYGEIVSVKTDLYVIKTESMGTLKINKSKVLSINFGSVGHGSLSTSDKNRTTMETNEIKSKTASLERLMKNDKEMMSSIMSLQNHPDLQTILSDPAITEAINSGNISQLLSNPKIQKLMNNQMVKDITSQLAK